ncbi:MAG TPA: metallophosphoesterase [Prolixibacteraceae bacterium]
MKKLIVWRRKALWLTLVVALGLLVCVSLFVKRGKAPVLRFGLITDVHYADRPHFKERYYNQSLRKLGEFIHVMNKEQVDFIVELGDFKDQDEVPNEANTLKYLTDVEAVFQQFKGPTYHVLGNHDMDGITKTQFLERVENTGIAKDKNYYSFDQKGFHFIVMDGNYTGDEKDYNKDNYRGVESWIPVKQVEWLKQDLKADKFPAIVFIHQLLDNSKGMKRSAQNAPEVRKIMEDSGKVLCVFQGHVNAEKYSMIHKIHYYSFISTVYGSGLKNNSYVIVDVFRKGTLKVNGYRQASEVKLLKH